MKTAVGSKKVGGSRLGGVARVILCAMAAAAFCAGCGDKGTGPSGDGGTLRDSRDGKSYKTVRIGTQTWMAENLNYNASGSVCYDNSLSNCGTYGRLYNWVTAMALDANYNSSNWNEGSGGKKHRGVCPSGWHLPSEWNWIQLRSDALGSDVFGYGEKLKSTSGWSSNGNGTDDYGFSALPGGYGAGSRFFNAGDNGYWWSTSEEGDEDARVSGLKYDDLGIYVIYMPKTFLLSVRCVQD